MKHIFVLVEMLNKGDNAAFVEKLFAFIRPLVMDSNLKTAVEKCQFAQSLGKHIIAELRHLEYFTVRLEGHLCAP